jgi:sulfate transport system ATP-binding protein
MSIAVKAVTKRFGGFVALDDVSLDVPGGSLVALLGPSGSGKTTLLRIIAGLEIPDHGAVLYQGEDVTHRSARDRNVGFVFQHYALFRHMSVFENIAFGLRVRRWPTARVKERVHELLQLIRLDGLENRAPSELSGGQRQRVALARALAVQPKVLLLDEPFGALDAKVRQELRQWLRRLHDEIHMTSVFVTHDQEEAFEVADHVVVMRGGRVEQRGTPQEVFEQPANAFVMDFLGNVNVFHGRVENGLFHSALENVDGKLLGSLEVEFPEYPYGEARPAAVYVRPHELLLSPTPSGASSLKAKVLHVNPTGPIARVLVVTTDGAASLTVDISRDEYLRLDLKSGDNVYVSPRRVRVFLPNEVAV